MTCPSLYYIGYLPAKTGGELVNLQHVATLHQHGVRAVALVNADAPDADFAGASLPLERLHPDRRFGPQDVVVIPDYYRDAHAYFARLKCRRVLHTQGPFLTFRGFDTIDALNAAGFEAGIACSQFGAGLMQRMGAAIDWQVVTPFVHPLFQPGLTAKKRQIAYMPSKRPKEAPVVRALFRHRYPALANVPWVPIADVSRRACAAVMAESAVFASFSYLEGLGLPPLEAMASNCLVCGFDGHGGTDYATPDNGQWVKEGDHQGFADAVHGCLSAVLSGGEPLRQRLEAGRQTAARFSQERFTRELLAAWQTILGDDWQRYLNQRID